MKAPTKSLAAALALSIAMIAAAGSPARAQCTPQIDTEAPAWFEGTVGQGVETVPIYVDSGGSPISTEFEAALQDAIEQWKADDGSGDATGVCADSENLPKFEIRFGSRDNATPPLGINDIRRAAIALDYQPGVAPPFDAAEGTLTLAAHDPNTNTISVYGKCPGNAADYGIPCNDATNTIDWVNTERYGQKVLAHELGHALHLAHDTCANSVMQEQLGLSQFGGAVLVAHCTAADDNNDDRAYYQVSASFSCVGATESAILSFKASPPNEDPFYDTILSFRGETRPSHTRYKEGTVISEVTAEIAGNPSKTCTPSTSSTTVTGDTTIHSNCSCNGSGSSSAIYGDYLLGEKGTCDMSCSLDDPIPGLRDHCERVPATCYDDDPYGGGTPHSYTTCWRVTQSYSTFVHFADGTLVEIYWVIETTQCKDGFVVYSTPLPLDGSTGQAPPLLLPRVEGQTAGDGPITAIVDPEAGETLSGTVELSGFARDDAYGTGQVALWIDNEPAPVQNLTWGESFPEGCVDLPGAPASGCNPNMGWSATLDTTQLSNGTHTLQVVAVSGRAGQWPPVTYRETTFEVENCLDETKPTVSLDSPTAGEDVTGLVNVAGTFGDNVGVTRADLLVDGNVALTDTSEPFTFTWDSSSVAIGDHTLRLRARDACGNWGFSVPTTVSVWNPIPGGAAIRVEKAYDDFARLLPGSNVVFPDADEGESVSRLFTITNDGDTTLELSNPSNLVFGDCWHQLSPYPTASVPSGGSTSFRVRMLCGDYGAKTGTVTLQSN
ncbi:MAG: Ig-like domain-containing protein, partial [Acidobacteriota bacterium]